MARILYGVSGEGSGHSSRSREMIEHLLAGGHTVRVASYDRGYRNLSPDFDVVEIEGLHIATVDNKVSLVETFVHNLARLPDGMRSVRLLSSVFEELQPDCAITDFEPITAHLAPRFEVPLVSLDNQHRMRFMRYPCPLHLKKDGLIAETLIRAMVPRPDVSLVTTFYRGEVKNDHTLLFPPVLGRDVLALEPRRGEHVLVYCTQAYESLLDTLTGFPREELRVYGWDRTDRRQNLHFRPFSRDGFLDDLASAKAVIATAGFTLMTEALHLRKPYLALPMRGQFEQQLNALLLEELGFGSNGGAGGGEAVSAAVAAFLDRLPEYERALAGYPAADNREIRAELDGLLADGCARLETFHRC